MWFAIFSTTAKCFTSAHTHTHICGRATAKHDSVSIHLNSMIIFSVLSSPAAWLSMIHTGSRVGRGENCGISHRWNTITCNKTAAPSVLSYSLFHTLSCFIWVSGSQEGNRRIKYWYESELECDVYPWLHSHFCKLICIFKWNHLNIHSIVAMWLELLLVSLASPGASSLLALLARSAHIWVGCSGISMFSPSKNLNVRLIKDQEWSFMSMPSVTVTVNFKAECV